MEKNTLDLIDSLCEQIKTKDDFVEIQNIFLQKALSKIILPYTSVDIISDLIKGGALKPEKKILNM